MKPTSYGKAADGGKGLSTWFAAPQRVEKEELSRQIEFIAKNPLVTILLTSASGLIAVLNEYRQILAVNDTFLAALGIDDPFAALGLRPGEVLQCIHSQDNSAGCGTGKFCSTCGAAIAITAALSRETPIEKKCLLTARNGNASADFCFMVKASPLSLAGGRFVLIFLQDITEQERRANLERAFLHDIKNTIMGLDSTVRLISQTEENGTPHLHERLRRLTDTLIKELQTQTAITANSRIDLQGEFASVSAEQIIAGVNDFISNHPAVEGKLLSVRKPSNPLSFRTDLPLLLKVIVNMLVNALEATDSGNEVKFWIEKDEGNIAFRVWNRRPIPRAVRMRIFQRFFSTKSEPGRGFGTFSMKYIGEKVLGGKVDFVTSRKTGTIFSLSLPLIGCCD